MKNISIVQIIILIASGFAVVIAVAIFALGDKVGKGEDKLSEVIIWGDLSSELFNDLFNSDLDDDEDVNKYVHIKYVEKTPETFEDEFVTALAEGNAPDMVLLRENQIISNQKKLIKIPFSTSLDKRTFQETFIPEAELLIDGDGFIGIPIIINPLVLYYNRNILDSTGIVRPPETWTELLSIAPSLTVSDTSFNISKSVIALGSFENIKNAKEILWALILQTGNNIIVRGKNDMDETIFKAVLNDRGSFASAPSFSAINYFNQFANPSKTIYSWNRALPEAQDFFVAGNSAFYIGFADELPLIKKKNPNLNFDVATLPQSQSSEVKRTYGKMYFLGIVRTANDLKSVFQTMIILSDSKSQERLSKLSGLPPIRRDNLGKTDPSNSFDKIFKKSALFASGVMEPEAKETRNILAKMVQSIQSGELEIAGSVTRANDQLNILLEK